MNRDPEILGCPRCGCPVEVVGPIVYPDNDVDEGFIDEWGDAVCPNCNLSRCPGMGCWCLNSDGTPATDGRI